MPPQARYYTLWTVLIIESRALLSPSPPSGLGWKPLSMLGFELEQGLSSSRGPQCYVLAGMVVSEILTPWSPCGPWGFITALSEFIVIPGNKFDKVATEGNASPSIKGGSGCHRRQLDPLMPPSLDVIVVVWKKMAHYLGSEDQIQVIRLDIKVIILSS